MGLPAPFTISVCIPTCNRPQLLREALESALSQTLPACEILIGDDSSSDASEKVVAAARATSKVPLIYFRNLPPLRQAANTNRLFRAAAGECLVLLHDDDLLLPTALADLAACWKEHPELTAAYGKQYIISQDGTVDEEASLGLNRYYFRSEEWAGMKLSSAEAGVLQQFPNDGYLVRSSAARAIRWRPSEEVGNGCEYDFGLRLGLSYSGFFFVDAFTAKYRSTEHAISKNPSDDAGLQAFLALQNAVVPDEALWARELQLKRLAHWAFCQLLRHRRWREAFKIYFSRHYPMSKRLDPRGIAQLSKALATAGGEVLRTL